jgi:putative membrane protein
MQLQDFINMAAQANLAPIELSKVVQDRVSSQDVKDFAKREIEEHGKINVKLTTFAQSKGLNLAGKLDPRFVEAMKRWEGLSGHELELRFMELMVVEHDKGITLFEQATGKDVNADLQAFARDNLSIWREQLNNARKILERLRNIQQGNR